jgi:hypothetical protein
MKPQGKFFFSHLIDLSPERQPIAGNMGALTRTAEKPKRRRATIPEDDGKLKPTQAMNPYIFFCTEEARKLTATGELTHKEAFKQAGEKWRELMNEEQKAPYTKMSELDKIR